MALSGQCPVCRATIALSEATLSPAPVGSIAMQATVTCDQCDATLTAIDLGSATEIAADCQACGSNYVVDRSGAGEALPCRCGAVVTIPNAVLAAAVAEPNSQAIPPPAEITSTPPQVNFRVGSVAEVVKTFENGPADETLDEFRYSNTKLRRNTGAAEIEADVDEESSQHISAKTVVTLPIVAVPELFQIQIPESPPESVAAEIEADVDEESSQRASAKAVVTLPIVAGPELFQIQIPESPPESVVAEIEADVDEESSQRASAKAVVRLPIVAAPELFRIQIPAPPPESVPAESEAASSQLHHKADQIDSFVAKQPEQTMISCPGCKREYSVVKAEMGQTAECECGFVFVLQENIAAVDSAFCADLMPFAPLAIDRTGSKIGSRDRGVRVAAKPTPLPSDPRGDTDRRRRPMIISLLFVMAAGFLIGTFFVRFGIAGRFGYSLAASGGPSLSSKLVTPIPIRIPDDVRPSSTEVPIPVTEVSAKLSDFLLPVCSLARTFDIEKTLGKEPLYRFSESVNRLDGDGVEFTVDDLFWLAESWEEFGSRAENQDLASKCFWQAACAFALAQTLETIEPDERAIAMDRQQELSDRSRQAKRVSSELQAAQPTENQRR